MYYILCLLIGYAISWLVFRFRTSRMRSNAKQQIRNINQMQDDYQRKEKNLNLEIMARDKKISSAQKKYETLQLQLEQNEQLVEDDKNEQDKISLNLKNECEQLKQQIAHNTLMSQNLLADRDRKLTLLQADHDNIKLKFENSFQDNTFQLIKNELDMKDEEIAKLKLQLKNEAL